LLGAFITWSVIGFVVLECILYAYIIIECASLWFYCQIDNEIIESIFPASKLILLYFLFRNMSWVRLALATLFLISACLYITRSFYDYVALEFLTMAVLSAVIAFLLMFSKSLKLFLSERAAKRAKR